MLKEKINPLIVSEIEKKSKDIYGRIENDKLDEE